MTTRKSSQALSTQRDKYLTSEGGEPERPWCVEHDDLSISILWGTRTIAVIHPDTVRALIDRDPSTSVTIPVLRWP